MAKTKKKAAAKKVALKKSAPKKAVKKTAKAAPKKTAKKSAKTKPAPKMKSVASTKSVKASPKMAASSASKAAKSPKQIAAELSDFMTPLDDRLIVQLKEKAKKTAGGLLYIPDTVDDVTANIEGTVVAVGRGHRGPKGKIRPMDVQVGDEIVFADHAGSKLFIKNEELVILRESDVMGILS